MKARIKFGPNSGREIDVEKFDDWNYRNVKSGRLYGEDELDFLTVAVDWSSFRREAAKDILCSVLAGGIANGAKGFDMHREELVSSSIQMADELIKQIKEK